MGLISHNVCSNSSFTYTEINHLRVCFTVSQLLHCLQSSSLLTQKWPTPRLFFSLVLPSLLCFSSPPMSQLVRLLRQLKPVSFFLITLINYKENRQRHKKIYKYTLNSYLSILIQHNNVPCIS